MNQFTTSRDFYIGVFTQSGPKAAVQGGLNVFPFILPYSHIVLSIGANVRTQISCIS